MSIETIGFLDDSYPFGKIACLRSLKARAGDVVLKEKEPQRGLVTTTGLEDDMADMMISQPCKQSSKLVFVSTKGLEGAVLIMDRGGKSDVKSVFGDVDASERR